MWPTAEMTTNGPRPFGLAQLGRATEQHLALAGVARHRGRELEFRASLLVAAELREEVAAHAWQQVVAAERSLHQELVHELEALGRAECHPNRHRSVQLDDRRAA